MSMKPNENLVWPQVAKLEATVASGAAQFGYAVSVYGNTIAVGTVGNGSGYPGSQNVMILPCHCDGGVFCCDGVYSDVLF